MSTFEEAVDIVSNKMNKTLSNDELKEVYIVFIPTYKVTIHNRNFLTVHLQRAHW